MIVILLLFYSIRECHITDFFKMRLSSKKLKQVGKLITLIAGI